MLTNGNFYLGDEASIEAIYEEMLVAFGEIVVFYLGTNNTRIDKRLSILVISVLIAISITNFLPAKYSKRCRVSQELMEIDIQILQ